MSDMSNWMRLRRLNEANGYVPDDLAGVAELAEYVFHVAPTVITSWNARRDFINFPPPVVILKCGPVFSVSEYVMAWNDWTPKRGTKSGTLLIDYARVLADNLARLEES